MSRMEMLLDACEDKVKAIQAIVERAKQDNAARNSYAYAYIEEIEKVTGKE